jgi:hypothetical protein
MQFSRTSHLFCFVLNQTLFEGLKDLGMQDKRKDQILSSWTEPPFEAPQVHLPPNPSAK